MSLSKFLADEAKAIRESSSEAVAVAMLKQAGLSDAEARTKISQNLMEKEAASHLQSQGIDYDTALRLVKTAGVDLSKATSFTPELTQEEILADKLEKAASYAWDLEQKIADLETKLEAAQQAPQQASTFPDVITKLASAGAFTAEDLAALQSMPETTLHKIAAASETPWQMGKAAGVRGRGVDPLTDWLLS